MPADEPPASRAEALLREASELIGSAGSFRLRTLVQMALNELAKHAADAERDPAAQAPDPSSDTGAAPRP